MLTGIGLQHKRLTVIRFTDRREPLDYLLSPDEQERAARFRFPELRERFRVGRGTLRLLLGQACNAAPEYLRFIYSPEGKPSLADFPEIGFNVSHSGDLWACVIDNRRSIGLDIEQIKPLTDRDSLARRFFSPSEYEQINSFPEPERQEAFFRCWTRKEAYLKATGAGLSKGLASFTVSCGEEEVAEVRDSSAEERWFVRTFIPSQGYAGAVCTCRVYATL